MVCVCAVLIQSTINPQVLLLNLSSSASTFCFSLTRGANTRTMFAGLMSYFNDGRRNSLKGSAGLEDAIITLRQHLHLIDRKEECLRKRIESESKMAKSNAAADEVEGRSSMTCSTHSIRAELYIHQRPLRPCSVRKRTRKISRNFKKRVCYLIRISTIWRTQN